LSCERRSAGWIDTLIDPAVASVDQTRRMVSRDGDTELAQALLEALHGRLFGGSD